MVFDSLEMYDNCTDPPSNNLRLNEISLLLQNKQKPIRNSCRSNLWSTPILIL